MPEGILIFGANGSGKSTIGLELARTLEWKYMDIEAYHFVQSGIPYTVQRTREDCVNLMLADIEKAQSFVLSAVTGDFGEKITSMYKLAVQVSAPLCIRMERIQLRTHQQYGARVQQGGDMYEQNLKFIDFAANRPLSKIEQWAATLPCPVLQIDGTKPISENIEWIVRNYGSV